MRKVPENGKLEHQTIQALQYFIREKLPSYYSGDPCPINGKLDVPTVKALQYMLDPSLFTFNFANHADGEEGEGEEKKNLAKTGVFDSDTKAWLQKYMNQEGKKLTCDGEFGKNSIIALQSMLNNKLLRSLPNANLRLSGVSGAAGVINGLYIPDGEFSGHRRWKMPKKNVWIRRGTMGNEWEWRITTSRSWRHSKVPSAPCFFVCSADPGENEFFPPAKGWTMVKGVRGGNAPEIVYEEPAEESKVRVCVRACVRA